MSSYTVRKLKLDKTDQLDHLARCAGDLYSATVTDFWRVVRKKGIWLKGKHLMRWHNHSELHAHSADAVVQQFFSALKSWRELRKVDPDARPPRRRKRYFKITWKSSAIRLKEGSLTLANGRGNEPLMIPWRWEQPKLVEIGWNGKQYELRACYTVANTQPVQPDLFPKVAAVDLGEIHLAAAHDGEQTWILNGKEARSKRQYRNKLIAKLDALIDVKPKGSQRRREVIRSKKQQVRTLNQQLMAIYHQQTTRLITLLKQAGVEVLVIGDIRDLRKNVNYGKKANQKIHQMPSGKIRQMLTYKAERAGMVVALQDEAYTSQECPQCGERRKPRNRHYRCTACGFEYHRDGVGAMNIRRKYLELAPVVGVYGHPHGLAWSAHQTCNSEAS